MANKLVDREVLKAFREKNDQRYKDGSVVPLMTKEIEALSEDSGTTQETPFINQGTATSNNDSSASVDTGPTGKQLEKQGNTVVVNQLAKDLNATNWNMWSYETTLSFSNGVATFKPASGSTYGDLAQTISIPQNHKIVVFFKAKATSTIPTNFQLLIRGEGANQTRSFSNDFTTSFKFFISNIIETNGNKTKIEFLTNKEVSITAISLIDLTKWFGANSLIPQDLLDNPSHWSWYQNYGDYIAYNTGELVNCAGRYLECGASRNAWDEVWEVGGINYQTGINETDNNAIRSKNYIDVIPNRQYYFKTTKTAYLRYYDKNKNYISSGGSILNNTFTTPSNCAFIRFQVDNLTTYNHDITISLYYATGVDYDQYYPYEEQKTYDTGTEVLRKAGSVKDTKAPDGTITRRVGSVDLSTLSWTYGSNRYRASVPAGLKPVSNGVKPNWFCDKYNPMPNNVNLNNETTAICYVVDNQQFIVYASSSSAPTPTGTLYYELATPTTEQGTPFAEVIEINDMSYMAWKDTSNALVSIPQGCKIFYPAWYVGFIDSLGQREDINWAAEEIVSQNDLIGYVKQVDLSSGITDSAGLTYEIKNCYKVGHIINLSIQAQNNTGSTIAQGTTLFKIPSGTYHSSIYIRLICALGVAGAVTPNTFSIDNFGNVTSKALSDGAYFWLNVSYII